MLTPSATRATSPALTERPINPERDDQAKHSGASSVEFPTLKYMAVLETSTDKAIFEIEPKYVNDTIRNKMAVGSKVCTQMIGKGYGEKVKMQDIFDVAVQLVG
jgi:hypothetical protein